MKIKHEWTVKKEDADAKGASPVMSISLLQPAQSSWDPNITSNVQNLPQMSSRGNNWSALC